MYVFRCVCVCVCVCVRERERERERDTISCSISRFTYLDAIMHIHADENVC